MSLVVENQPTCLPLVMPLPRVRKQTFLFLRHQSQTLINPEEDYLLLPFIQLFVSAKQNKRSANTSELICMPNKLKAIDSAECSSSYSTQAMSSYVLSYKTVIPPLACLVLITRPIKRFKIVINKYREIWYYYQTCKSNQLSQNCKSFIIYYVSKIMTQRADRVLWTIVSRRAC